jgi:hypothetical protein
MISAHGIAVYAKSVVVSRSRVLAVSIGVICSAHLAGPLWGQTWTGGPTGPIYYNGGNVGIGTASPGQKLEVGDTNAIKLGSAYISSGLPAANHAVFASNAWFTGSYWAIPNAAATSQMLQFYGGATYFLQTQTPGLADWQYRFTIGSNGNVGIGTTNPTSKLSVNGTIQAKEVIVNTGWSDYVFEPAYHLRPLNEVAAYIKENHHLPEIPSEAEVQQNGVGLGEMQSKLLAKIEELTLHMIQADEQNRDLRERLARLEKHGVNGGGQ